MFNLAMLNLGQAVNDTILNNLVDNQNFQLHNNQIIGDCVQWTSCDFVTDKFHLDLAPQNTAIYIREHYFGMVELVKLEQGWFVSQIKQWS